MPAFGQQPLSEGSWTNRVGWTPDSSYRGPWGQDLVFLTTAFLKAIGTVPDVRLRLTIFRNTGRRMSVNSKMSLVGAGSTVTVVDFDLQDEFQDLVFGDSVKTREHVTGMNTGSKVFSRV